MDAYEPISAFDLRLELQRPPETSSAETGDRVPSVDPWYPTWCLDWGVTTVHLSTSVMGVTVRPRRPAALQDEDLRHCKEELRTVLRFVAHLAAEYGLLRPVVGIVRLDPCTDSGNDVPSWLRTVRGWAGDQDWHRGEFLLFVETNENDYLRRCGDLLAPAPATWSRAEPRYREVREPFSTMRRRRHPPARIPITAMLPRTRIRLSFFNACERQPVPMPTARRGIR